MAKAGNLFSCERLVRLEAKLYEAFDQVPPKERETLTLRTALQHIRDQNAREFARSLSVQQTGDVSEKAVDPNDPLNDPLIDLLEGQFARIMGHHCREFLSAVSVAMTADAPADPQLVRRLERLYGLQHDHQGLIRRRLEEWLSQLEYKPTEGSMHAFVQKLIESEASESSNAPKESSPTSDLPPSRINPYASPQAMMHSVSIILQSKGKQVREWLKKKGWLR